VNIPPDLALEGKRFKEELADAALAGGIFVSLVQFLSVLHGCFPFRPSCARADICFGDRVHYPSVPDRLKPR
jgi:hypothetical protein